MFVKKTNEKAFKKMKYKYKLILHCNESLIHFCGEILSSRNQDLFVGCEVKGSRSLIRSAPLRGNIVARA